MADKDSDALKRILKHAAELAWSDYRGALGNWQRKLDQLMAEKPQPPVHNKANIDQDYWT